MISESPGPLTTRQQPVWRIFEKVSFRAFFVYAFLTAIPLYPGFYQQDFETSFQTRDYPWRLLDVLSQNNPWFFSNAGGNNYAGWGLTLLACFALGVIWHVLDRKRRDFTTLSYWFYTLVRYSLALRMSWFAIAKVWPVQMPFPTLSQLNTNLGDFTPGKLYWLTTGVSPVFEVFAGVFELIATVLILFRRTTTLGALMMVAILVPIWFVNIGYDAGVELTSLHILTLALLLLAPDAKRFWDLLIRHQPSVLPVVPRPAFSKKWQNRTRVGLKTAFILIFLVYRGFEYSRVYAAGKTFKLPLTDGIADFAGFYDVTEFRLNNQILPYSPNNPARWQNVVFETFNTISIRTTRPIPLNTDNKWRTTEYYGNTSRFYYGYDVDTVRQVFLLKNRADTTQKLRLAYERPTTEQFILKGLNEAQDSIRVVLTRQLKKYPLVEQSVGLAK